MKPVRIAVVGVGALGRHHARILSEMDSAELVAVVDRNPEAVVRVAEAAGCEGVSDIAELPNDLDAVSIVVPTTLHLKVASGFLANGTAVFVEKPIAASVEEALELRSLAEVNNAIVQVGHIERFNPATALAWERCGTPKYIRAERLSTYSFRSTDIGVVHDLMIHDLDLILDLVKSPIKRVEAFGVVVSGDHEDCVQARVGFENGCIADITASRMSPTARRSMQVWTDTGCVSVDFGSREVFDYSPSDSIRLGKSLPARAAEPGANLEQLRSEVFGQFIRIDQPEVSDADALTAELSHFVECVESGNQPVCSANEGIAAMQAAAQVLESVQQHQWDGSADGRIGPQPFEPWQARRAG